MTGRTYDDVKDYVESQIRGKCKVISAKVEQKFNDLGVDIRVWNVKTDLEGDWWVVEGNQIPMNLYTQGAFYFGADEAYSFHMGLVHRMNAAYNQYKPEDYVNGLTLGSEIVPSLFRKIKSIATLIDTAKEVEDFQAIGVQSREVLIALGNYIYKPFMSNQEEQPKESDFKHKAASFISFYYTGSDNSEYRNMIKRITDATWEYACKITHSQNATFYEASTCVSLCISLVCLYENVCQKIFDPISQYYCSICRSKKLKIKGDESDENGNVSKLFLICEECGAVTTVSFGANDNALGYVCGIVEKDK